LHEVAATAGLIDAAAALGIQHQGFVSLVKLVRERPDYLMVSHAGFAAQDQGEALLIHPALIELYPVTKRFIVPSVLSICEGPATPALIDHIAAEVRAKVR
jgi:iron complex transport system substrate-binding protein